jgi:hypothetical protein
LRGFRNKSGVEKLHASALNENRSKVCVSNCELSFGHTQTDDSDEGTSDGLCVTWNHLPTLVVRRYQQIVDFRPTFGLVRVKIINRRYGTSQPVARRAKASTDLLNDGFDFHELAASDC